mmetsp:Transcript_274/g.436  ORF Transcript_274/g.436 Transcript_274/m.436 type:complete len:248 (+) Transcript_274:414-1157(+)
MLSLSEILFALSRAAQMRQNPSVVRTRVRRPRHRVRRRGMPRRRRARTAQAGVPPLRQGVPDSRNGPRPRGAEAQARPDRTRGHGCRNGSESGGGGLDRRRHSFSTAATARLAEALRRQAPAHRDRVQTPPFLRTPRLQNGGRALDRGSVERRLLRVRVLPHGERGRCAEGAIPGIPRSVWRIQEEGQGEEAAEEGAGGVRPGSRGGGVASVGTFFGDGISSHGVLIGCEVRLMIVFALDLVLSKLE